MPSGEASRDSRNGAVVDFSPDVSAPRRLKIWGRFRSQQVIDDFVAWAADPGDPNDEA